MVFGCDRMGEMADLGNDLLAVSASCVSTTVQAAGVAGAEQSSVLGEAGEGALLARELLSEALQLLLLAEAGGQTDLLELKLDRELH